MSTSNASPMDAFKAALAANYLAQAQAKHLAGLKAAGVSDADALHLTTETSRALLEGASQIIDSVRELGQIAPELMIALSGLAATLSTVANSPFVKSLWEDRQ